MVQALGRRPDPLNLVSYAAWRPTATTGLIVLQHSDEAVGRAIQRATESDYSHSAMVVWKPSERFPGSNNSDSVLMLAESYGPRSQVTSMRWRIKEASGNVDVYRLRPDVSVTVSFDHAAALMFRFAGQKYPVDWLTHDLLAIATGHVVNPIPDSDDPEFPRHCSGALHWAFRCSGFVGVADWDYLMFPGSGPDRWRAWSDPDITEYLATLVFP